MRQHHSGNLVVIEAADERLPIGLITDRDIVIEVLGQGRDPTRTTVAEVMTKHVVIASGSETIAIALERMNQHGVRRLPIIDDDRYVVGIVTLDDLIRLHAEQAIALFSIIAKEQNHEGRTRR